MDVCPLGRKPQDLQRGPGTMRWEVQIAISTYREREITPEQERGAGSDTGDIATRARRQLRGGEAVGRVEGHPMECRSP
jgi:hypothetical protein